MSIYTKLGNYRNSSLQELIKHAGEESTTSYNGNRSTLKSILERKRYRGEIEFKAIKDFLILEKGASRRDRISPDLYEPPTQRSHEQRQQYFEARGGRASEANVQLGKATQVIKSINYKARKHETGD